MEEHNVETCAKRNIHERTREDIERYKQNWEPTPKKFNRLDLTELFKEPETITLDEEENENKEQISDDVEDEVIS